MPPSKLESAVAKSTLEKVIGELLIQRYQELVEQPLPPLILQLLRKLNSAGDDEASEEERPRPMKADLFLPDDASEDGRADC
jgi:hypothetical protein